MQKRTWVVVVVLLAVVVCLTGCGKKNLISVNGESVSRDEFYARLEKVPVQTPTGTKMAGEYVVEQLINERLVQAFAKEKGVPPTDAQIDKRVEDLRKRSGNKLPQMLQQNGMTLEELKGRLRVQQSFINVITKGVSVDDAIVKKAYDDALKAPNSPFKRPSQVRTSIIIAKDKAKIDKAYKMLQGGTDFGTVAMRLSEDETKSRQGIMGWLSRGMDKMPKVVEDAAFSLDVGKVTSPFQVQGSWAILKVDQKRPSKITGLAEVRDQIKEQLMIQKGSSEAKFRDELKKFVTDAKMVVSIERYKNVPENIKKQAVEVPKMPASGMPGR